MKTILIIFGIIAAALIIFQLYAARGQKNIEKYPYQVVTKFENVEIRNYEATLFTSVEVGSAEYKKASRQGFSVLAGYIFGGNDKKEKIAMTSPVAMSLEDSMTVMFMVPKDYSRETLPKPNQSSIKFKEEPAKTMAAISFGGWANDEKIDNYKNQLTEALNAAGIKYTDRFFFLGYNAPYELLNRKNEVVVELLPGFDPATNL